MTDDSQTIRKVRLDAEKRHLASEFAKQDLAVLSRSTLVRRATRSHNHRVSPRSLVKKESSCIVQSLLCLFRTETLKTNSYTMEEFNKSGSGGCCCFACVRTQQVGIVEDLGQFKQLLDPGLHCITWPLQNVVGTLTLRIQQLDVYCETKTKDNVFVQVAVAVQYRVLAESAYEAYYRLTDPRTQIQSYVFDVVRSTVPKLELDQAFSSKDDIADAVLSSLRSVMKDYGYEILNTLVTDLSPDNKVKASMNEINASRRLKEAASHKAEAEKVKQVKAAEGEAEAR